MTTIPSTLAFGKGHYQLTTINNEKGEPIPRGILLEPRLSELLDKPTGNLNYVAQAALLRTEFQTRELLKKWDEYNETIKTLKIPKDQCFPIQTESQGNKKAYSVPLQDFEVMLARSEMNPSDFFWVGLTDEEGRARVHLLFHQGEICIVSNESIHVTNQDNAIKSVSIYCLEEVVIDGSWDIEQYLNVYCSNLEFNASDPINTGGINFLCLDHCSIAEQSRIGTKDCLIRAGFLNHKGHIDSASTSFIAELIEVSGTVTALDKNGISMVSLGLYTTEQSHLHAGKINIMTGAPVKEAQHPLFGKAKLNGLISSRGLTIFSNDLELEKMAAYVQGNITLFAISKLKMAKTAQLFFNGEFIYQKSLFAAWIEGEVVQCPELEVFHKRIIISFARLSISDSLRLNLPRVLVHQPVETLEDFSAIAFLSAFKNQADYFFKPYDKSQFTAFEVDAPLASTQAIAKILFSATDYLFMQADFSLTSAEMTVLGNYVDCSSHIGKNSAFGLVSLALKSLELHLSHLEFDNQNVGQFLLESKEAEIRGSYVNAENVTAKTSNLTFKTDERDTNLRASQQVTIKSDNDSRIEESTKLVLRSPQVVQWDCKNFYLRGSLDFEQVSIKAERLIYIFRADIQGQSLNADADWFFSFLSAFSVKKSLSIRSIVSLIALCDISSDLYSNTSIVNFSCAFYRPATLSLNGKSLLSCSLAATNTLISILQLALHDPTAQLALTLIRVGINVGPALYQAVQLSKALHAAATKKTPLERGEIITLLNQSKVLLLSMGSMVYTGVGIANQCMHFDPAQLSQFGVQSWTDIVKDINSVAAPLLGLTFGKRSDNLLSLDADLVFCASDTNLSLFRVKAGWEFSPISSETCLGLVQLNPYSFDVSPVMSTSTSLWSVSASQETISPVGLHSERTFDKTYLSTGLPTLSHDVSLTTHHLHYIGEGSHSFTDSSIQTDSMEVANRNVVELYGSTLHVSAGVDNQSEVILANSQATAKQWHNQSTGLFLAVNSGIRVEEQVDAPGSVAQVVASSFHADTWKEQGKFAADASQILSEQAQFDKEAHVDLRASDCHIKQLNTAVKVGVDFKGSYYGPDHQFHTSSNPSNPRNHSNPTKHQEAASEGLDYVDNAKPTVSLTAGGAIQYDFDAHVALKGEFLSALPLAVKAPQITVYDSNISSSLTLNGNVTFDHAQVSASGSIATEGGKMVVRGGEIDSGGAITIDGEKTSVVDGAKLIANGDITVKSDNELISTGKVKTTSTTETQKKWFGLSKTTNTETRSEFTNNTYVSVNGDVALEAGKGLTAKGNDIWGENIRFGSKDKMAISPLLGAETSDKTHSNLFHTNEYNHSDETASASHLSAKNKISFTTTSGNIENIGSELSAPNGITMTVPKTAEVINAAIILNSYYTESHTGLYFKPIVPLTVQAYVDQLPLVQNVGELAKNHDLSSAINLSVNVVNTSQNELSSLQTVGVVGTLANNFLPEIGLTFKLGKTQIRTQYQRQGSGSITTCSLKIQGGTAVFLNDPSIQVALSDFMVDSLRVIGADLTSSITVQDNALVCTYSPLSSQTSFGLNHADLGNHQRVWKGDLDLGSLSLQADEMSVYGSQVTVKRIEGHVNQLIGDVGTNLDSHNGHQFTMNTSGSFSYDQQTGCSETAAFSKLFKGENNEAFDSSQFSVDTLSTHGDPCAEIKAEHRNYEPIVESQKSHSFSLSGSLSDLKKDSNPSTVFSAWNAHASHVDKATSDKTVLQNDQGHFGLVAPIYHASAGNQFLNTVQGLFKTEAKPAPTCLGLTAASQDPAVKPREQGVNGGGNYQTSQEWDPAVVFSLEPDDDAASSELDKQIDKNFAELVPKTAVMMGEAPASVEGPAVFRGDSRPYSEIHEDGLSPKGDELDLFKHGEQLTDKSGYISTSESKEEALKFPHELNNELTHELTSEEQITYLYELHPNKPGIEVAKELLSQGYFIEDDKDFAMFQREQERAFSEKITPSEIKGCWEVQLKEGMELNPTAYEKILQQNFPDLFESVSRDFLDTLCHGTVRTPLEPFIPNPNYNPGGVVLWNSLRTLGHGLTGLGLFSDGMTVYLDYTQDKVTGDYTKTWHDTTSKAGGWASAYAMGSLFAEQALIYTAPLTPLVESVSVFVSALIGGGIGYYMGSESAGRIYDYSKSKPAGPSPASHPVKDLLEDLIPPAFGAEVDTPDNFVSPLLGTALNLFQTELRDDTYPREYLTNHNNFGILAEVAIEDIERINTWNHSFQTLLRSPEMDIYLSEVEHFHGAEAAFNGFFEKILNPFCERLFDKASYLYPMYAQLDGNHFLTKEVFAERDVPMMVERIGQNIDARVHYFENMTKPLRCFYFFTTALEDMYQISQGRSVLPLIKEEAYSTIGAVSIASFAQELSPYFTDATFTLSKAIFENEMPTFLRGLNLSWKYVCPVTGMFIGGLLGGYIAEKDEANNLDVPLGFGMARQLWDAGVVRERIGAAFKDFVVPTYASNYLSEHSATHYYDFMRQLSEESNLIGRSLMKPISRELFAFSQIGDTFPRSMAEKFGKEITEETLYEYCVFGIDNQYKPIYNVNGDFFRELIDKHSDFSTHRIDKFKTMAKTLVAVAAAETIVKLATAEDKVEEALKIALSYGAAEAGASVAIVAGSAICATSPFCLAGMGLLGGIGGGMLAEEGWDRMQEDAHLNPPKQLPSFNNIAAFFKPSEFLDEGTRHSQSLRKGW